MEKKESIKEYLQKMLDRWNKYDELDGFVAESFRVDLEKTLEYWDLRIADNKEELDKAREEGKKEYLKEVELMQRFSSRKEIDLTRDEAFKRLVRLLKSKLKDNK